MHLNTPGAGNVAPLDAAAVGDELEAHLQAKLRGAALDDERRESLLSELRAVLNRHSIENASNTPDFLLASFLGRCLDAYAEVVSARDRWFGIDPWGRSTSRAVPGGAGFDPNGKG